MTLDLIYGKQRAMAKFKALEIVARVPYQTWEHVAYIAVTHVHQSTGLATRIQDRIVETRSQQDNELWHLLILQDLIARDGAPESRLKFFWLPQLIAFGYYYYHTADNFQSAVLHARVVLSHCSVRSRHRGRV